MIQPIVVFFVASASLFGLVHWVALRASLYWYYWWFDVFMHFWGGLLITLGIVAVATIRRFSITTSYWLVLFVATIITANWELFEWYTKHVDPIFQWQDTLYDIVIGIAAALIGYYLFKRLKQHS